MRMKDDCRNPDTVSKFASSAIDCNVVGCSMAADLARGIGGWPAPEIARIDATLPQHWWQPSALSRLEGAFSSLCLPAMPASLAGSPAQGE